MSAKTPNIFGIKLDIDVFGGFLAFVFFIICCYLIVTTIADGIDNAEITPAEYNTIISLSDMCPETDKVLSRMLKDNKIEHTEYKTYIMACEQERRQIAVNKLKER